jgi:opacity protein-like surface antigen
MRFVACAVLLVLVLPAAAAAAVDPRAPRQQHTAADTKRAKAIVLRLGDLAAGWKLDPPAKPSPPCTARPDESHLVQTAKVDPSFTWKDGVTNVGSEVDVFRTAAEARADWRASTRSLLATCLLQSARTGVGKTVRVTLVSAHTLAAPKGVERSLHYQFVFARRTTQTVKLVVDVVAIGRGRVNAVLHSVTVRTPLPAAVVRALTGVLAARLNAGRGIIA